MPRPTNSAGLSPRTASVEIRAAGDAAFVVDLGTEIDPAVNARVIAIADGLRDARIDGVRDVMSSYASVTVCFDPLRTDVGTLTGAMQRQVATAAPSPVDTPVPTEVPVSYGGAWGPDLELVAHHAGCSPDDVIRWHAAPVYQVYLLGFVPGFAYLGRVDERIAIPRRDSPRLRVPIGSVGIAGSQTGIYPAETPGGWQLIGRTTVRPFDPGRDQPFLFGPGDTVRFVPTDASAMAPAEATPCVRPV